MKLGEKIKDFYEDHKAEIWTVGGAVIGAASVFGAYTLGYKRAVMYGDRGLSMCFLAKPELKPMLEEALQKAQETIK